MHKILVSACLFDQPVRYDARPVPVEHPLWAHWKSEGRLVAICPEMAGGLPAPRAPAEIFGNGGGASVWLGKAKVIDAAGNDYSDPFREGANLALQLAKNAGCSIAVLKANSPSCGNRQIYDGGFRSQRIAGSGVTATLLMANGIQVFNETELDAVEAALAALDDKTPALL